jgi:hypothetical protein
LVHNKTKSVAIVGAILREHAAFRIVNAYGCLDLAADHCFGVIERRLTPAATYAAPNLPVTNACNWPT